MTAICYHYIAFLRGVQMDQDNERAVRIIQGEPGDIEEAKAFLCRQNKGLICSIIKSISRVYSEDLEQEGYIAILQAAETFDNSKQNTFAGYAGLWIKQRIMRYMYSNASTFHIPENQLRQAFYFKSFLAEFEKHNGREPLPDELNMYFGDNYPEIQKTLKAVTAASLQSPIGDTGEDLLQDIIPGADDPADTVTESVFNEQLAAALWPLVGDLEQRQQDVVKAHFKDNKTFREYEHLNNLKPGEGGKTCEEGLKRLRNKRVLKYFWNDLRGDAMRGCGVNSFNRTWTSSTEREALRTLEKEEEQ